MLVRFQKIIRNYFGFSQKETKGTVLLSVLLLFLIFTPFFQNVFYSNRAISNKLDAQVQDSLANLIDKLSLQNEPSLPDLELHPFDPNKISKADWLNFGLNKKVAERIERYQAKGGKFRKKEDLLRVYDFPQDLYETLDPYIQIEVRQQASKYPKKTEKKYQSKSYQPDTTKKWTPKGKKQFAKLNLNTADTAQLKTLRGIGEKRALNIIKYREKLGGFAQMNQIEEVWGLDSTSIESIRRFTYIEPGSWKKIAINLANEEELKKHPYISPKLAKILVNYRLQHGKYHSEENLRKIKVLEEVTLQKLLPYLSFD